MSTRLSPRLPYTLPSRVVILKRNNDASRITDFKLYIPAFPATSLNFGNV